jgi:hypothetical protein
MENKWKVEQAKESYLDRQPEIEVNLENLERPLINCPLHPE